jgi:hypothetical protein
MFARDQVMLPVLLFPLQVFSQPAVGVWSNDQKIYLANRAEEGVGTFPA